MEIVAFDVNARALDRLRDRGAAQNGIRDLRDRAGQANRAGAAEREPRAAVVEHDRRRHHAREPRAGNLRPLADHVELAEHVVQLRAAAKDPRAGAQRRGERGCVAVGVDDGDLRRAGDRQRRRGRVAVAERLRSVGESLGDREPLERGGDDCAAARGRRAW